MSAHTPGPWRIADDVYPSFLKVDGPSFKLSVVMWATDLDESDYQSRLADLRLIAAAPELLEALIDVVAIAQLDKWDQAVSGRQSFLWNAKVAIAKAKGETQ